jgi:enterochelin esterase-like enzyme
MPNFALEVRGDTTVRHEITDFRKDPSAYMADVAGSGVVGTLIYWPDVPSRHLDPTRHVEIWLPPGYEDDPTRRYPVIYMSDGQNLFDPRIANTGTDWGVDEAMMAGTRADAFEPAVVVGVWSTERRLYEYSPWHEADRYARFLLDELMPRVEGEFRVRRGPEHTFHMGSSMGGLLSWYLVSRHPEHFSACGCLSTHFVLSPAVEHSIRGGDAGTADTVPYIDREIEGGASLPPGTRYFFDHGTEGLDARYGPVHARVEAWLRAQGMAPGRDYLMQVYEGADHDEASWRARLGDQLRWLLAGSGWTSTR